MKRLLLLLSFFAMPLFSYEVDLAVCAIFQNEASYLKEWIDFHRNHGVERFYLYNNLSNDDYIKVLSPYIKKGIVELFEWPYQSSDQKSWNTIQCDAYNHCLFLVYDTVKWCAFIDTDEFLFSPISRDLKDAIKLYKDCSGICVNWVCYGASNIRTTKLLKNLLYRSDFSHDMNKYVKSIVRVKKTKYCSDPHFFYFRRGNSVTENQIPLINRSRSDTHSVSVFRINHYWSRDLGFFHNEKIPRHLKWNSDPAELIQREKDFSLVYDPILAN